MGTEKRASPTIQQYWIVPTKPGAEGIMIPIPIITNNRNDAYIGNFNPKETSKKYMIITFGNHTNRERIAEMIIFLVLCRILKPSTKECNVLMNSNSIFRGKGLRIYAAIFIATSVFTFNSIRNREVTTYKASEVIAAFLSHPGEEKE